MFKLVILLSVAASAFGAAIPEGLLPQLDGRIVGGNETSISIFPWQISLQRNGMHSCGGTIMSFQYAVTAAHCLQDVTASVLQVRSGSRYWNSGGTVHTIYRFLNHADFNAKTMENDIALLKILAPQFKWSASVKSIAPGHWTPGNTAKAVVSGWGVLSTGSGSLSPELQSVNLRIIGQAECQSAKYGYGNLIKNTMICAAAEGKGICHGDSGSPMVSGNVFVGIVSWGYGCADPEYPGVYTNVADFYDWIYYAMSKLSSGQ